MPRIYMTPQDKDSLVAIASRIEKVGPQFRAIVEMMEEDGLEIIEVSNYLSMIRGLEAIEGFCFESKRRILEFRHDQGRYVAQGEKPPSMNRRRKPKKKKAGQKVGGVATPLEGRRGLNGSTTTSINAWNQAKRQCICNQKHHFSAFARRGLGVRAPSSPLFVLGLLPIAVR